MCICLVRSIGVIQEWVCQKGLHRYRNNPCIECYVIRYKQLSESGRRNLGDRWTSRQTNSVVDNATIAHLVRRFSRDVVDLPQMCKDDQSEMGFTFVFRRATASEEERLEGYSQPGVGAFHGYVFTRFVDLRKRPPDLPLSESRDRRFLVGSFSCSRKIYMEYHPEDHVRRSTMQFLLNRHELVIAARVQATNNG